MDPESLSMAYSPSRHELFDIETYKEECEVERIVGREVRDGYPFYNIKWKGWPTKWNTWEPIHHMFNSIDTVIAYEEGIKDNVRRRRSWLPTGEQWKLKLPLMTSSYRAFLEFIRECVNAEKQFFGEAEEIQAKPSDAPAVHSGETATVIQPPLASPAPVGSTASGLVGMIKVSAIDHSYIEGPVGQPSAFNFGIHNEDTELLESSSEGSSEQCIAPVAVASSTPIPQGQSSGLVARGMNSADGEAPPLNFASCALPWVRTASDMTCGSDSVSRRQPQFASSCNHGRTIMLVHKQTKSCRRRRKWRQNLRRRKAEAKKLCAVAPQLSVEN